MDPLFSFISPGKNPIFSSASTIGRVKIIFLISPFLSLKAASTIGIKVFPVPAGPYCKDNIIVFYGIEVSLLVH